jgi:hypothetical protein
MSAARYSQYHSHAKHLKVVIISIPWLNLMILLYMNRMPLHCEWGILAIKICKINCWTLLYCLFGICWRVLKKCHLPNMASWVPDNSARGQLGGFFFTFPNTFDRCQTVSLWFPSILLKKKVLEDNNIYWWSE